MQNENYEKRLKALQTEIGVLDITTDMPIERLRQSLPMVVKVLEEIKEEVLTDGFENEQAEIDFFKHIKPAFYALQIYEVDLYNLRMNQPPGTPEMLRAYYEQELLYVFRLFRIHAFYYQYYRTQATQLDRQYFLRSANPPDFPILENIQVAKEFSTPLDYLFAKFMAAERYQEYLLNQLADVMQQPHKPGKPGITLSWTGDAINLAEIAYGIWLTGQVNNGNATITEIMNWLEVSLHVKTGVAYRRWAAIAGRKRISVTKFIDQMKEAILKRLEDENGL